MNEIFNYCYIHAHKNHSPVIITNLGSSTENLGFTVSVSSNEILNKYTVYKIPLDCILRQISKEKNG